MSQHIVKNRIQMYFELKKKEITNSRIFHSSRRKKVSVEFRKYTYIYIFNKRFWPREYYSRKRIILEMRFQCFF